jgi:hypothetical protein
VLSLQQSLELTERLAVSVSRFDDGGVRDLLLQELPKGAPLRVVDGSKPWTPVAVLELVHRPAATGPAASALHQ